MTWCRLLTWGSCNGTHSLALQAAYSPTPATYAHLHPPCVQRDLKPQNLLLSDTSQQPLLKIADFGFARNLHPQVGAGMARGVCPEPRPLGGPSGGQNNREGCGLSACRRSFNQQQVAAPDPLWLAKTSNKVNRQMKGFLTQGLGLPSVSHTYLLILVTFGGLC